MIGIAFGWPTEQEKTQFGIPDEVRFARIEQGQIANLPSGRTVGPYYWRKWELPLEERTEMAKQIVKEVGHRPREIEAFTLYYQSSVYTKADGTKSPGPGFQMSVRRKGEPGWDIRIIPEEEAIRVFRLLKNVGHPDGPWELTDGMRTDVRDSYIVPQSAVEGWPRTEPPKEIEYFDDEEDDDLLMLLEAAQSAVERRTVVQATTLPDHA